MTARLAVAVVAALVLAPSALADTWLPHPANAEWTYEWTDTAYATTPTREKVTVKEQSATSFTLQWTTLDLGNPPESIGSVGEVRFHDDPAGLMNDDWLSSAPPRHFPVLCAVANGCRNSLASTYYNVIWGSRAPVLPAPLLKGSAWASTGGADGDVTSASEYLGTERVTVPAWEQPVVAAKVRSDITQAGALGDPYGSGIRTVWWVYGVGPVKIVFEHAGGTGPVTTSSLINTNLEPKAPPPDAVYFPLDKGLKLRYSWTNSKHMKKASVQQFEIDEAVNQSARFTVKHISGPIRVAGFYGFTLRADGVTNLFARTQHASLAKFPPLGPRGAPAARRRHFATPFDLMVFGFNPLIPAYGIPGTKWIAKNPSRDFSIFGVNGNTRVIGVRKVKVKAGTFNALVVQSRLIQRGFRFGSGTRTMWFAPGKGLVKLVFRHADRSVSTVQLLR